MSKLQKYKEALEKIASGLDENGEELTLQRCHEIADLALNGVDESEAREKMLAEIAGLMLAKDLIFSTAEEIAASAAAEGLTTMRGKPWTKASIARYMPELREIVLSIIKTERGACNVETAPADEDEIPNLALAS